MKDYKQTTGVAPKFVPRQLGEGKTVKVPPTPVDINSEQVRLNACVLGPVSGPALPIGSQTKDPASTHTDHATVCDTSYKKTISSIRQTIKQVSSYIRENVHQVGSILFQTTVPEDGGRNVEVEHC